MCGGSFASGQDFEFLPLLAVEELVQDPYARRAVRCIVAKSVQQGTLPGALRQTSGKTEGLAAAGYCLPSGGAVRAGIGEFLR